MPIQSRCPSCAAALPTGAAWCSLCHADLRSRREPASAPSAAEHSVDLAAGLTTSTAAPSQHARPSGRHSRDAVPEPSGRREARRSGSTRTLDPAIALEGIELPTGEVTDAEVDALADQMLKRLAATEPPDRLLDPSDLPGGKWGVGIAAGVGVLCVMLILFTVLGSVFG